MCDHSTSACSCHQEQCPARYVPLACCRPRLAASCLLQTLQREAWTSPLSSGWCKWTVQRMWTPTSTAWGALHATYQVSLPDVSLVCAQEASALLVGRKAF